MIVENKGSDFESVVYMSWLVFRVQHLNLTLNYHPQSQWHSALVQENLNFLHPLHQKHTIQLVTTTGKFTLLFQVRVATATPQA